MPIQQINPQQAYEILKQDSQAVYVDVRSIPEFERGHPEKAINLPILHMNEETRGMAPNPDFTAVAQAILPKDQPLIVGCQVGGRSQKACEALAQLGFEKLYNVQGGFGGMPGAPGWSTLGLPVSQENGDGVSYESLLQKVRAE